ncbi:MAG: hypothetical protein WBL44_16925 [Nitrososphaeraceae archaeon]
MNCVKCLFCVQGEYGGRAELDTLINSHHSIYNHDMNGHLTKYNAELQNKQDKLEKAVDELWSPPQLDLANNKCSTLNFGWRTITFITIPSSFISSI